MGGLVGQSGLEQKVRLLPKGISQETLVRIQFPDLEYGCSTLESGK